jgi:hypothetical protein
MTPYPLPVPLPGVSGPWAKARGNVDEMKTSATIATSASHLGRVAGALRRAASKRRGRATGEANRTNFLLYRALAKAQMMQAMPAKRGPKENRVSFIM